MMMSRLRLLPVLVVAIVAALAAGLFGDTRAWAEARKAKSSKPASTAKTEPPNVSGLAPLPDNQRVPLHLRPPGAQHNELGPSPVIFPPQTITLRFNHKRHVKELGVSCTTCHLEAKTSRKSSDNLLPPPERCDGCHGSDHRDLGHVKATDGELKAQCGFCHLGYRASDGNRVQRLVLPKPNLRFDHSRHIKRNIKCAQCHGQVAELELATRDQLPRMRGCFRCHQAPEPSRGEAKGDCRTCHLTEKRGSVLKTSFASGKLMPPRWLHDAGHGPDFIERHKRIAGADSQLCATCHQERFCTDCHDGRVRPRRVHPNDFLSMHPIAARQDNPRCASCHQQQDFCLKCHQRAGVSLTGPHFNVSERGRFHPPKRVWTDPPRSRNHHAWEAQKNINACVSCHIERDCTVCHATARVGGRGTGVGAGQGVNPHPAGFRARCRRALRKNARPCLVCHDPADPALEACR